MRGAARRRGLARPRSRVVETLNPLAREDRSVGAVKVELDSLKGELRKAHERVHLSEARLAQTQQRLSEMQSVAQGSIGSTAVMEPVSERERAEGGAAQGLQDGPPELAPLEELETGGRLREFWYPIDFTSNLTEDKVRPVRSDAMRKMRKAAACAACYVLRETHVLTRESNPPNILAQLIPLELFGEPWVLFRDKNGMVGCVRDSCAHRACPLSLGKLKDGEVQCPYHGWQFSASGECTKTPSTNELSGIRINALPCVERDGMIWVYPGREEPPEEHQNFTALSPPDDSFTIHAQIVITVPVEHGLLMENLLDLAHAPFTHTSTFAKGWSVPERVDFKTVKNAVAQQIGGLGGSWEPYPIDMAFQPPCMVLSQIGLVKPGQVENGARQEDCDRHLHQLHVCLPAKDGETRLLYRMSLDFAQFAQNLPFVEEFWKELANQVLGEDLVLVEGQQRNMELGLDVWKNPVAYDKLGVRYRRWRTQLQYGKASLRSEVSID